MRITGPGLSRHSISQSRNRTNNRQSIDRVVKLGITKLKRGQIRQFAEIGLDNNLVLKYIHEIYDEYNLEDPFSFVGQPSIQNTPISVSVRQSIDYSRHSVALSRVEQLKKSIRQELERTAIESEQGLSRLQRVRQSLPSSIQTSRFESEQPTVPCYRFCIVCECMIEQNNILNHQKSCEGFDLLYRMSAEQVVQYLTTKIERYEGSILSTLKIKEEFHEGPVHDFIRQIKQRRLGDIEASYLQVVQSLPSKSMKILELCYKLKWFRKVLQQFQIKAGLA